MKTRKIKHVWQQDKTGCGIAIVAMVAGKTYKQIRRKALKEGIVKETCFGTTVKSIKQLLSFYKIEGQRMKSFYKWRDIPTTAIASTSFTSDGWWHWVLYVKTDKETFLYDPWDNKGKKRKHFNGLQLGQYMTISKKKN